MKHLLLLCLELNLCLFNFLLHSLHLQLLLLEHVLELAALLLLLHYGLGDLVTGFHLLSEFVLFL